MNCYCCSAVVFENCCEPLILGVRKASSCEQLMRSRFSAYATQHADYIIATTHISTRKFHRRSDILEWSVSNKWLKLEILNGTETTVNFKAFYQDEKGENYIHHELSTFKLENDSWYYVDGTFF